MCICPESPPLPDGEMRLKFLSVLQVHWKLSSKRVLTAEWIDGCKVTDKEGILAMGLSTTDVRMCIYCHGNLIINCLLV